MDNISALIRYCYIGSFKSFYISKDNIIDFDNYTDILALVEPLHAQDFLKSIEPIFKHKTLPKKDQFWFIYATYMCSNTNEGNKKLLANEFVKYALLSEELFMYANFVKKIRKHNNKKGFPGSVRRAISIWYEKQDVKTFMKSMCRNSCKYGFSHKDLIALCHVNIKDSGMRSALNLAIKPKKIKDDQQNEVDDITKLYLDAQNLKKTGDNLLCKKLVKENQFTFENFSMSQLNNSENWEIILPTMTYFQLMKNVIFLTKSNLFLNGKLFKAYSTALDNGKAITTENIHPVSFLILKKKFSLQVQDSEIEKVKQSIHSKAAQSSSRSIEQHLNSKISKLFYQSFDFYRNPPMNILIAINVSEKFKRQYVLGQKQLNCLETALTLALSFYKSAKTSVLYTFSGAKMKKVEWKKKWNYIEANEFITPYITPKVLQRLALPISESLNHKESFDLFLIIVGSATYGNSNSKPDQFIEALEQYRKKKNGGARAVIVNLRRLRPALEHKYLSADGILEICGINHDIAKIINAFTLNHFK